MKHAKIRREIASQIFENIMRKHKEQIIIRENREKLRKMAYDKK